MSNEKKTFLNSNLYNRLYENASAEWAIDHIDDSEEKLECSLCGQKGTKKKFYLRNKFNGTILNVGSSCIVNFKDIRDSNGKTAAEVSREWEKQQKRKMLNDKYPGIIKKIDDWNKVIDEIPTIILYKYEQEYNKIYKNISDLYKKYMKSKKFDEVTAQEINDQVCIGDSCLQKINDDISKKKGNEWYITKDIKEWCLKNREENKITIEFLKEDGIVKWRSACRIFEVNLVKKVISKLKNVYANSKILIKDYNESNNSIIINIKDGTSYVANIDLECKYDTFMKELGEVVFNQNEIVEGYRNYVVGNSKINANSSVDSAVAKMQFLIGNRGLKIVKWDMDYNEIIASEDCKQFFIVNAKQTVNDFIRYVFSNKLSKENVDEINKYVIKNGEKVTKEEYENRLKDREKAEKVMQVDYSNFV